MAVTTWRSINIGNSGSANALAATGAETLQRGLQTLGNVAENVGATQAKNWNIESQNNTTDVLTKLNSFTSAEALTKELEGGAFAVDTLDAAFGRQYNKAAVSDAAYKKRDSLLAVEKANKALAEAELNKKVTLEKDSRLKKLDAIGMQLLTKAQDDSDISAGLYKYAKEMNPDGVLSGADIGGIVDSYVKRFNSAGLDDNEEAFLKLQESQVPSMISEDASKIDMALKEFQRKGRYDPQVENLVADSTPVSDAIVKLSDLIKNKGEVVNSQAIATQVTKINEAFKDANLPLPNGKIVYEIMAGSGHDDKYFGFDAKYELNDTVVQEYIQKIKHNQSFKETNAERLLNFANAKKYVTDTAMHSVLNNRKELQRASRTKSFSNEVHTPALVDMEEVRRLNQSLIDELNKITPAGL